MIQNSAKKIGATMDIVTLKIMPVVAHAAPVGGKIVGVAHSPGMSFSFRESRILEREGDGDEVDMILDHSRSRDISRGFPGILVSASEFSNHFIQSIRSAPKGTESSPRIHVQCHVRKSRTETRRVASEPEAGARSVDCSHDDVMVVYSNPAASFWRDGVPYVLFYRLVLVSNLKNGVLLLVDCPHARSESFEGSTSASVPLQDALIRSSTWVLSTAGASRWMWWISGLVSSHLLPDLVTENGIVLEGEDEG